MSRKRPRPVDLIPTERDITDTKAALDYLWNHFAGHSMVCGTPLAFQHHVYSVLNDRTAVDRDVVALAERGAVRLLHCTTSNADVVLVRGADFTAKVNQLLGVAEAKGDAARATVLRAFRDATARWSSVELNLDLLETRLHGDGEGGENTACAAAHDRDEGDSAPGAGDAVVTEEEALRVLVSLGLLARCPVGPTARTVYRVTMPGMGEFARLVREGRAAVLTSVQRSKYAEVLESRLRARRLKKVAALGLDFHVWDLLGSGLLRAEQTPSGVLLQACGQQRLRRS